MNDDQIFDQSLQCLWSHCHHEWGDRSPLDVFNRLLAKNIRPPGWTKNTHLNIQRNQVESRQEHWTTEALAKLPRGHTYSMGVDVDCPIIIAIHEGQLRLLDGNHRINHWVEQRDLRTHKVNIHNVADTGQFIELSPVSK